MLTNQRGHFTILWSHTDGTPGRVDPNEPLDFLFDPVGSGTITELETHDDGRTPTSTTTTGWVEAGEPATSAACDCTGDADFGAGKKPVTLRLVFSVESPEEQVTSGTFSFDRVEDKP